MPPSDPSFVNTPPDVWTPVAVDTVSVTVNILEAFADLVYYQTYRPTGGGAPDNTPNPGDVDFEGVPIFNRRDRIAGQDVFVGGVDFQTSAGIDVYIYPLEKAGKVRVDSLAAGGDGGGAVSSVDTRVGDVTLGDLYEPVFAKSSAFNKNFGLGAGQVAEGNVLATKITGPGSSQINQIFVAVDANGNAKIVPVKIDDDGNISGLGNLEHNGTLYRKQNTRIVATSDGTASGTIAGGFTQRSDGHLVWSIGPTFAFNLLETGGSPNLSNMFFQIAATRESPAVGFGALIVKGGGSFDKNLNIGGDFGAAGDIKTIAWADYGGISTITGFSSVSIKAIWYKKVGKLVFVNYKIIGTSSATNFTFTLPFASKNSAQFVARTAAKVTDDGVSLANSGQAKLTQFSNIVTVYPDWTESLLWTATGTKHAEGQFWYETT